LPSNTSGASKLLGKSARVDLTQPYQIGHWSGLLNGAPATVDRNGFADTSVRFAVNLIGAPPLAGKEFAAYRAKADHETIVGVGLVLQLPTGQYYDDKLINLGNNRFTFRPQLGVIHNWGKWSAELTAQTWFFTDNDDFFSGKRLEQDLVYGADAHLIYTFRPGLWLSGSFGYAGGGTTTVNGVSNDNNQCNIGWGLALGLPISRAIGVKIAYIGTRTEASTGLDRHLHLRLLRDVLRFTPDLKMKNRNSTGASRDNRDRKGNLCYLRYLLFICFFVLPGAGR